MDAPYGSIAPNASRPAARPIHLTRLMDMHATGEKIAAISAYDATFAVTAARSGIECILVNEDMVTRHQGRASHEDITLDALAYHVGNVAQGLRGAQASAWVMGDLPASCYGASRDVAIRHASRLVIAGAQMVRMKLDRNFPAVASFLTERGIAVCGHVKGIQKWQTPAVAASIRASGAMLVILECMEEEAVLEFSTALPACMTLGLHAGQETSGQLLSIHALLGLDVRNHLNAGDNYLSKSGSIQGALAAYVTDVKAKISVLG